MNARLPAYYTQQLDFRLASLGNDAGVLGAASLCRRAALDFSIKEEM
jgi:glucokinase